MNNHNIDTYCATITLCTAKVAIAIPKTLVNPHEPFDIGVQDAIAKVICLYADRQYNAAGVKYEVMKKAFFSLQEYLIKALHAPDAVIVLQNAKRYVTGMTGPAVTLYTPAEVTADETVETRKLRDTARQRYLDNELDKFDSNFGASYGQVVDLCIQMHLSLAEGHYIAVPMAPVNANFETIELKGYEQNLSPAQALHEYLTIIQQGPARGQQVAHPLPVMLSANRQYTARYQGIRNNTSGSYAQLVDLRIVDDRLIGLFIPKAGITEEHMAYFHIAAAERMVGIEKDRMVMYFSETGIKELENPKTSKPGFFYYTNNRSAPMMTVSLISESQLALIRDQIKFQGIKVPKHANIPKSILRNLNHPLDRLECADFIEGVANSLNDALHAVFPSGIAKPKPLGGGDLFTLSYIVCGILSADHVIGGADLASIIERINDQTTTELIQKSGFLSHLLNQYLRGCEPGGASSDYVDYDTLYGLIMGVVLSTGRDYALSNTSLEIVDDIEIKGVHLKNSELVVQPMSKPSLNIPTLRMKRNWQFDPDMVYAPDVSRVAQGTESNLFNPDDCNDAGCGL